MACIGTYKKDILAISNLLKSLNENGILVVSVPIYPEGNLKTIEDENILEKDYDKLFGHSDHCRAFGYDYKEKFFKAGFSEVKDIDANDIILKKNLNMDLPIILLGFLRSSNKNKIFN